MTNRQETRLLLSAAVFLLLYAAILTLSPAVRERSWSVQLRWSHWIGIVVWFATAILGHVVLGRKFPNHDPFIFPCLALLAGWGILTIWRLDPYFGWRQCAWFATTVAAGVVIVGRFRIPAFLHRHKHFLLGLGLALTALTLLLGSNPAGVGPRLWLGCCGLYLQPSEPLKFLLVAYLAAYLADKGARRARIGPLLFPSMLFVGLAILLVLVQRDLGTACILVLICATMLYVSTGNRRLLGTAVVALLIAVLTGFLFVDVVRARIDTWIDPWNDPSGRSYQVVQSLIAIANGGILGRGPGLGSPSLVPVAQSDFIFTAVAEETGLTGGIGLVLIYALLLSRGLLVALRAPSTYYRLLAAGLTAYLGIQTIIILGGNLRLLPLTGVTLPLVSYGGSSLATSVLACLVLIAVSSKEAREVSDLPHEHSHSQLALALCLGMLSIVLAETWWVIPPQSALLSRTDNARRSIADRYVMRGAILDRNDQAIDMTQGTVGELGRVYLHPALSSIVGYTHPSYGQAGLESTLDPYLRGLAGNPAGQVWWNELLYGAPPPGADVRLSLDLALQSRADEAMQATGAAILLGARSGEILAITSRPTFDANRLDQTGDALATDRNAPLLNRATQGLYPPGGAIVPLRQAFHNMAPSAPIDAASLYAQLGFDSRPMIEFPSASFKGTGQNAEIQISPLQLALAAAALSNGGFIPPARIVVAVRRPGNDWVDWKASGTPTWLFSEADTEQVASALAASGKPYWEWASRAQSGSRFFAWYLAGTLPAWHGTAYCDVVILEDGNLADASRIGRALIEAALSS